MRFFSNDSLFGRFFGALGDIITVNVLFIVCSLPVVTIGAAWTAACYTFIRKRRMPDASLVQPFLQAFRDNLKQSTIAWLASLVILFVLITDLRIFSAGGPHPSMPVYVLFLLLICAFSFTVLFLFPVIACFDNSLKMLVTQAFFFAAGKPHVSLALAAIACVPALLTFWSAQVFWAVLILWAFMGFGTIFWLQSLLLARVFKPYLPEIKRDEEED